MVKAAWEMEAVASVVRGDLTEALLASDSILLLARQAMDREAVAAAAAQTAATLAAVEAADTR